MDFNKLTEKSREALHEAQNLATRFGHQQVDAPHLLLALLRQSEGLISQLLSRMEVDLDRLGGDLETILSQRPSVSGPGTPGMEPDKLYITL